MRKTSAVVVAAAVLAVAAGCGGSSDDSDEPASSDSSSSEAAPSPSEEPTETPSESETEETEEPESGASDPGPAPQGAVIAAGASAQFPDEVGDYELADGSSGPAAIYSIDGGPFVSASFLSGSDYAAISAEVAKQKTPAGTGVCGLNSGGTSDICYLKAADGVVSITADAASVPLADVVTFSNQLTEVLGTS